jgi:hypothetical protein
MTAARQERKPPTLLGLLAGMVFGPVLAAVLGPVLGVVLGIVFGLVLGLGIFTPLPLSAASDNQMAVNAGTGLAISGFDPVAYFTEGKALFGRPEFELNLDGAVWRFTNEGNKGAFAKHPEIYAPRFAGYEPLAIGRGRSVQGHPLIWAVAGQRLYLFYSEQTRASLPRRSGTDHRHRRTQVAGRCPQPGAVIRFLQPAADLFSRRRQIWPHLPTR